MTTNQMTFKIYLDFDYFFFAGYQSQCILVKKQIIYSAVHNTNENGLSQKCCKEMETQMFFRFYLIFVYLNRGSIWQYKIASSRNHF